MLVIWSHRFKIYSVCFLLALFITAPASILTNIVQISAPGVWLGKPKGSLWQGEVDQAIITIQGGSLSLGKVQWSINPLSLLRLSPSASINAERLGQSLSMLVAVYPNASLELTEVKGEFPLSVMESWAPILVDGHVFFDIPKLQVKTQTIQHLEGVFNLRKITWQGGDVPMLLGHYQAGISMADETINISLQDQQAGLGLKGAITATLSGQYQMDLQLTEGQGLNPAVMPSVAWLGKRQGGAVVIRRNGSWK